MRLLFQLTPATTPVPFAYQRLLVGRLHRWLGDNDLHDAVSLYSISWLHGGRASSEGIAFPAGARCFMSFYDSDVARRVLAAALNDPEFFYGMRLAEVALKPAPEFPEETVLRAASPVLIRSRAANGRIQHHVFSDPAADALLTRAARTRLRAAGLEALADSIEVAFERSYAGARTKLVDYNGVQNRASLCPVRVTGPSEAIACLWHAGIGHSTGAGFGAVQ